MSCQLYRKDKSTQKRKWKDLLPFKKWIFRSYHPSDENHSIWRESKQKYINFMMNREMVPHFKNVLFSIYFWGYKLCSYSLKIINDGLCNGPRFHYLSLLAFCAMLLLNNLIWFEYCNLIGWSAFRKFWLYLTTSVGIVTSPTYSLANDKFK
jgi:hypothetical protein